MSQTAAEPGPATTITTGGGSVIQGDVHTRQGDFVGRDKHVHYHSAAPQPGQLFHSVPHLPPHFVGRDELISDLVDQLCRGQSIALSADGQPGIGKTTLAVALACDARVLAHFTDGILWAGLGVTPDVASIQARWADALGAEITQLLDPYERLQVLSNAIGTRRLLIVLDDVWQLEAAQQLRCSGTQVVHLLTTRDQEIARRFAGAAQSRHVPELAPAPSYELLAKLAPEAYASDPAAAQYLADQVAGLPLALELLGGYLDAARRTATRRQQALTTLADPAVRLALATTRLGDARRQQVTLHETIALSLEDLPPATVAAFYSLGAFAHKPARFDLPAALAVSGADEEALLTLVDRNLLEMADDETLALHQTVADVARTQTPPEATTRHWEHYLALVEEDEEDWRRIETIYPQLVFAAQQIRESDTQAVRLVDTLAIFQTRRGLWQDRLEWLQLALQEARQGEQARAEARILNGLGYIYSALGKKAQALTCYEQALSIDRYAGNHDGEASVLNNIGSVYDDLGNQAQALAHYEQALTLSRQTGHKGGEATTLNNLGLLYDDLGNQVQALAYYEQALPLRRQVGDKSGEATTLNNIGLLYDELGNKAQALVYYEQALLLRCQTGDRWGESITCYNIARTYRDLGDLAAAERFLQRTVELEEALGHPDLARDRALLERVRAERAGTTTDS